MPERRNASPQMFGSPMRTPKSIPLKRSTTAAWKSSTEQHTLTCVRWLRIHHTQHLRSSCFKEPDQQQCCYDQKHDVKHGSVIETDRSLDHLRAPLLGNQPQTLEEKFNHQSRRRHRNVERAKYESGHLPPVILTIDIENGNYDQVGIDESNHATKANATVPQDRRQWDIPDGTDE